MEVNEQGLVVPSESNERVASGSLKTIATAEADFRANDRDDNGINDFWVKDVGGLYGIEYEDGLGIRLIEPSVAMADATPDRGTYSSLGTDEPVPRSGYVFAMLKYYKDASGNALSYDKGDGHNYSRFGVVTYPEEYGVTGIHTYILSEEHTVYKKDLGGKTVDTYPFNPVLEGWSVLD
jgi:hypothetical protein